MRKDAERKRELEVQQAERRAAEEEERRLQLAAALLIQATQRRRAAAGDATKRRAAVATLHAARKGFAVRRTLAAQREVDRLRVLRATFAASVTVQAARRREAATPCVGGCNPMCHRAATPVFWVCGPMFLRLPRPCTAGGVAKAARGARGAAGCARWQLPSGSALLSRRVQGGGWRSGRCDAGWCFVSSRSRRGWPTAHSVLSLNDKPSRASTAVAPGGRATHTT